MLPILRILPVGGVIFAIMILVLALGPAGRSRQESEAAVFSARGALMQAVDHPEWRQFLMLAAIQRADELSHLRELPDTPARVESAPDARQLAGLPTERIDADPEDETGTITEMPTIPVEIGETSSTELPMALPEEKPPVIRVPERGKPPKEGRKSGVHRTYRVKPPGKPEQSATFNLFEALFGKLQDNQPVSGKPPTQQQHRGAQISPPVTARATVAKSPIQ